MFKMIIVDDEEPIREGMKEVVDWGKYGITVIGTAANGKAALELLKSNSCDILLTDIRMPGMDGLELTKAVRSSYPHIKVVVLTAHDDFQYAQEAIRLGAVDYILKIGGEEELVSAIKRVMVIVSRDKEEEDDYKLLKEKVSESLPFLRMKFLNKLLLPTDCEKDDIFSQIRALKINLQRSYFQAVIFEIDDFHLLTAGYSEDEIEEVLNKIIEFLEGILDREKITGEAFINKDNRILLLINNYETWQNKKAIARVRDICRETKNWVNENIQYALSSGIGSVYRDIFEINKSYAEAEDAIESRFFSGKNSIVYYSELSGSNQHNYIYPSEMEAKLFADIRLGNQKLVREDTDSFFSELLKNQGIKPVYIKRVSIELLVMISRLVTDMGGKLDDIMGHSFIPYAEVEKLGTADDIKTFIINVITKVISFVMKKNESSGVRAVQAVKEYIENFYSLDLSISCLAEKVYISPNYLATIFKLYTGETIVDFINSLRVCKACNLLKTGSNKIYEISSMVGYQDPAYFSRIFKKLTGISPAEFKEKSDESK